MRSRCWDRRFWAAGFFAFTNWRCHRLKTRSFGGTVRACGARRNRQSFRLLENLVERDRFAGTCYRGANWQPLGPTQGPTQGRNRQAPYGILRVLVKEVKGKCARGYLWFYAVPGREVFLDFQNTCGHCPGHPPPMARLPLKPNSFPLPGKTIG